MIHRKKMLRKRKYAIRFFDFILKYWIIIAGIITGLFAFYEYFLTSHINTDEINRIRANYSNVLDLSASIVSYVEQNKSIDSLSLEYEIAYGKFIPYKFDTVVYKNIRDFRLELRDFRNERSSLVKLSYRQRILLKSIIERLKDLQ